LILGVYLARGRWRQRQRLWWHDFADKFCTPTGRDSQSAAPPSFWGLSYHPWYMLASYCFCSYLLLLNCVTSLSIFKYFLDYGLCDNSSICPTTQQTKILDVIYEVFKGGFAIW
jgi:hypothetical protein